MPKAPVHRIPGKASEPHAVALMADLDVYATLCMSWMHAARCPWLSVDTVRLRVVVCRHRFSPCLDMKKMAGYLETASEPSFAFVSLRKSFSL